MRKILLLAFFAYCGYRLFGLFAPVENSYKLSNHSKQELIMYSQTGCGYCISKAQELRDNGIAFTEYYIDQDDTREQELWDKLKRAGFNASVVGTPTFDAAGTILPNNPSLSRIMEAMMPIASTHG